MEEKETMATTSYDQCVPKHEEFVTFLRDSHREGLSECKVSLLVINLNYAPWRLHGCVGSVLSSSGRVDGRIEHLVLLDATAVC